MLHTLQEAIVLTGKSRRTIYNHCDQGRVSYSVGPDGRRYFDTAELIRAYGPLHAIAHLEPQKIAQVCTPEIAQPDGSLTEATALRLIAAIAKLVEIEEQKLRLLEYKPAPAPAKQPLKRAESFADLLSGLDD